MSKQALAIPLVEILEDFHVIEDREYGAICAISDDPSFNQVRYNAQWTPCLGLGQTGHVRQRLLCLRTGLAEIASFRQASDLDKYEEVVFYTSPAPAEHRTMNIHGVERSVLVIPLLGVIDDVHFDKENDELCGVWSSGPSNVICLPVGRVKYIKFGGGGRVTQRLVCFSDGIALIHSFRNGKTLGFYDDNVIYNGPLGGVVIEE